ncbi:3-deoxy-7-phosphoheptulonate synthase [Candidatus Peregrinibacteria bacterium CG22_combo_CG10-13_8_21_14_all_44_10]|nr:MAG: 3-deoxy-7-phosphoheptulonate synthase [Candidatus Peregrinibacteria bacterium CG2_30_44_17]PIP65938.1 MAG: 3-deoxy-7-phosphoheptulonate synthase [Candidatus Peregrinibacteria bacterium CG22_combo_CG10-13_8_21_14_all_44_10]PIS04167.1 MAG: 3-deoxy-7-phosphoheptulonate synthase [Candidatus Peregrinibacteria bacterium CG10_big_fil_rev_8_21_14_0_10_44_7]PIX78974.1 MAG: 3-deoxy-7-phosphoheptulonate synthase [Candidatus Peregrinibacteria bacterium CG_4_10_14_3_um_filter_44_21]PJB89255.1 MAG: 3
MDTIKTIKKLPSDDEVIAANPLSAEGTARVIQDRKEVMDILSGKDDRLIVITGPCSAWPADALIEYGRRLLALNEKVKDKLKLVLRVYIQKPRTTVGWTGPVNQPDPFSEPDIEKGVVYTRDLMVKLVEMGLPIADEALFTHNSKAFAGLLTWIAIGARSSEDQEHRIHASVLECPVGMKNPTSGSIKIGVNGVIAAQRPHTAVFDGYQVETKGNPYAHLVLRGGAHGPNYHLASLYKSQKYLRDAGVLNPAIIVDASHDNCKINDVKDPRVQMDVVREVMNNLHFHPELRQTVKGFMLESFIKEGSQKIDGCAPHEVDMSGLSITDPCLSWEDTEKLIEDMAEDLLPSPQNSII